MSKSRTGLGSVRRVCSLLGTGMDGFVRAHLAAAVLLVLASSVLTALAPLAFKLLIDGFSGAAGGSSVSALQLVVLYAVSQWLARVLSELRGLAYSRAERRLYRALSQRLFAHVMQLPLRFHLDRQTGAVSQTLGNGLTGLQMVLQHCVFTFLPVVAELATVAVVLTQLGQMSFLGIFCATAASHAIAFAIAIARISGPARAASAAHIDANAALTDSLLNYETVKYFAAEALVRDRYGRALERTESAWLRFFRRKTLNGLVVATLFAGFLVLTLIQAGLAVQQGTLTVGDFVLINTYLLQVIRPVEMLGFALQDLSQGGAFLEKMLALLQERAEPEQVDDNSTSVVSGTLEFRRVSLFYGPDRRVLKDVSFTVAPGRTLGIVGASGAGKSSLVRLLTRLVDPDDGHILLDGVPIVALALETLRRSIAVVPQDTLLFNDTIGYNIAFGKPGSTRERIEEAARLARLHDFIMTLPDGYETRVGERGVKLSGGERQRVSIARAVLKRPGIFVFDEATSSLDSATERDILAGLRGLMRASATLVIAHRLSTVVHADEIVVLHEGVIVERGTHATLLASNGSYASLWRAQTGTTSPCAPAG